MSLCLNPIHDIIIACRLRNTMDLGADNLEFFYRHIDSYEKLIGLLYVKDVDVLQTAVYFMKRMYPNVEDIAKEYIMLIERIEIGLVFTDDPDPDQIRRMSIVTREAFDNLQTYRFEAVEEFLSSLAYAGVYKDVRFSADMRQLAAAALVDFLSQKDGNGFFCGDSVKKVMEEIKKSGEPLVRKGLLEGFLRAFGNYATLNDEACFVDVLTAVAEHDADEEIRKAAIDYMSYCGGDEIIRFLIEVVERGGEPSPLVEQAAMEALLSRRGKMAIRYLEERIFTAKQEIIPLKTILEHLVSYESAAFDRFLLVKLKDMETEVEDREAICKILCRTGWVDPHTMGVLWDTSIRDPDKRVRDRAFAFVKKRLGGGNIKALLLKDKALILSDG